MLFRSVFRWERRRVDVSPAETPADVVDLAADALRRAVADADDRPLAVRLELFGASPAHEALVADARRWDFEIRGAAAQVAGDGLWLEKVLRETTPPAVGELQLDGPVGELLVQLREYKSQPDSEDLRGALAPLVDKLPGELSLGPEPFELRSPERTVQLLEEVEQLLLHRLRGLGAQP